MFFAVIDHYLKKEELFFRPPGYCQWPEALVYTLLETSARALPQEHAKCCRQSCMKTLNNLKFEVIFQQVISHLLPGKSTHFHHTLLLSNISSCDIFPLTNGCFDAVSN
jgi:hypothetical protein